MLFGELWSSEKNNSKIVVHSFNRHWNNIRIYLRGLETILPNRYKYSYKENVEQIIVTIHFYSIWEVFNCYCAKHEISMMFVVITAITLGSNVGDSR